jgi:tetratricopeptide (TPR) repeat protein
MTDIADSVGGMPTVGQVRVAEPDRAELAARMRAVVTDPEAAAELGKRASERIRSDLTWSHAARSIERRTAELSARPRTLSVCMIVRDEERLLARALASVRDIADQIVVVDTGSTDRTVEIARSFGAEVHFFPWADDFAAARNESIRHATGDWILAIDGDQELAADSHDELAELISACAPRAYVVRQFNHMDPEADAGGHGAVYEHMTVRLFRNHPAMRFEGAVHEQLVSLRPGLTFEIHPCGVVLHHHGYQEEHVDPVTLSRDVAVLERAVGEQPGDAFQAFNLASTYRAMGRFDDAEHQYLRAIALCASALADGRYPHFVVSAYLGLARLRIERGDPAGAVAYAERAIALRPDFADLQLTLGVALAELGYNEPARIAFERAITSAGATAHSPTDRAAGGWRARLGLADVLAAEGRLDEAGMWLEEAAAMAPGQPQIVAARERLTALNS